MGHAHHFLERLDRVDREQTEFALALYNDHEAVRYVLEHVSLPGSASRVALALDPQPKGPVVIVTRDGHFVTCLGAGMGHEHPVVARPRLEALLAKVADKRAKRELVQRELRPDEEEGDLLHRIFTRGSRLAREDFMVLSSFEPLLGFAPFLSMLDIGSDALKQRAALTVNAANLTVNGATRKALEKLDRLEWGTAHLTMLSGAADRQTLDKFVEHGRSIRASATFPCSAQGGATFYLRAAWMAARFGKPVIPSYKSAFDKAGDWMTMLDAACGLAAIGLRHANAAAEVKKAFEGYGTPFAKPDSPEESRTNIAAAMLDVFEHQDEKVEATLKIGQHFARVTSDRVPEGHPRHYKANEDVPDDVALTAALTFDGVIFDNTVQQFILTALPTAARAAPEEFYHPRELIRAWYGPWEPEETLFRLQRWVGACAKAVPVKVDRTPGRNDPCNCGSGKKWKKCHGSPQSVQ